MGFIRGDGGLYGSLRNACVTLAGYHNYRDGVFAARARGQAPPLHVCCHTEIYGAKYAQVTKRLASRLACCQRLIRSHVHFIALCMTPLYLRDMDSSRCRKVRGIFLMCRYTERCARPDSLFPFVFARHLTQTKKYICDKSCR